MTEGKNRKIRATFRLDKVGQKRYHRPQVHNHCDEKEEYLRRIFQRTGGWCEAVIGNREGHFGAVFHKRGLMQTSISQRGWNRGRLYSFRPLLNGRRMKAFFNLFVPCNVSYYLEIKRSLISYRVKGVSTAKNKAAAKPSSRREDA